jgi:hypothetical protein
MMGKDGLITGVLVQLPESPDDLIFRLRLFVLSDIAPGGVGMRCDERRLFLQ